MEGRWSLSLSESLSERRTSLSLSADSLLSPGMLGYAVVVDALGLRSPSAGRPGAVR